MRGGLCVFLGLLVLTESVEPPSCSQPQTIDHGITDWDGKSKLANFACYQGYHLVGPPTVECRYGEWYSDAPATYPTCKPIVCNYPVIPNGHLETGKCHNLLYRFSQNFEFSLIQCIVLISQVFSPRILLKTNSFC